MTTPDSLEKIVEDKRARIQRGHEMVSALCQQKRQWIMSIPARPDYDPDMVISDALSAGEEAITELLLALIPSKAAGVIPEHGVEKLMDAEEMIEKGLNRIKAINALLAERGGKDV